jgi:hypothetical protein
MQFPKRRFIALNNSGRWTEPRTAILNIPLVIRTDILGRWGEGLNLASYTGWFLAPG